MWGCAKTTPVVSSGFEMAIKIKKSHEGLLHRDTHTPLGKRIPQAKIKIAEHSPDPDVRKRARFADTAEHKFKHRGRRRKA